MTPTLTVVKLPGLTPYPEALETMRRLHAQRVSGERGDTLVVVEHAPVITLGRNAAESGVTTGADALSGLGIGVHRIERGGQATCHMPGQVVAYPVVRLRDRGLGVRRFTLMLEEAMIMTAEAFGAKAFRMEGQTGVWCGSGKVGAVGIAVKSGVTLHGVALNVSCDLSVYRHIIPCGRSDLLPSSLSRELGGEISVEEAKAELVSAFTRLFGD